MRRNIIELFGWYGAIAILAAYGLVSFKVIQADSLPYQILNLTGAIGILAISLIKKAKQFAFINIVWAVIALIAIVGLAIN